MAKLAMALAVICSPCVTHPQMVFFSGSAILLPQTYTVKLWGEITFLVLS